MKVYSKLTLAIEGKKNGIILAKDYEYDNRIIKQYCVFKDNKEVVNTLTKKNTIKTWYEVFLLNSKCHFVIDEDIKDTEGRADPKKRIENDIRTIKTHLIEYCSLQNKKITEDDIYAVILQSPSTDKKDSFHIIFIIQFLNRILL